MDKLAKFTHLHYVQLYGAVSYPLSVPIAGEGWQLWQGSTKVADPSMEMLYAIMQDTYSDVVETTRSHVI